MKNIYVKFLLGCVLGFGVSAKGQSLWNSAGTGGAWLTAANWTPSGTPGTSGYAQFQTNPLTAGNVGINMNGATNNGINNQAVGAIEATGSRSVPLVIGNSSTSANGTLTLNGISINSIPNVVVRNNTNQLLTIQNVAGSGSRLMVVALGNAVENIINIDGTGSVNISCVVSGSSRNFTKSGVGSGVLTLSGINTYSGNTTISAGTLSLSGSGSIANSPNISIGSTGTLNVTTLTSALSLGSGQKLSGSATGSNATGTLTVASGKGITLSAGGLDFTAYGGGSTSPLTVAGASAGALVLNSAPVAITTTAALAAGTYKLIAKAGSATGVTGTPGTLTINGSGLASGTTGALSVTSGELILTVSTTSGHTVTFDANAGTGTMSPQNASSTTGLTANAFTRTGYTFTGWNTVAVGGGTAYADGADYDFTADITLYAQWSINNYTVTFNNNSSTSGSPSLASVSGDYNTSVTLANVGTLLKTGYSFTGWNTTADGSGANYGGGAPYTIGASSLTLYANWQGIVSYNGNSNTGGTTPGNSTHAPGATVTVAANSGTLVRTGYTFAGWNTAADGSGTNYTAGSGTFPMSGDVTLYAKWDVFVGPCGTENFENITVVANSYAASTTWTGTNGVTWSATDARTDQTINTKAITIRNGALNFGLTTAQQAGGIGNLTINVRTPFGSPDVGTLKLTVNGTDISSQNTSNTNTAAVTTMTWSGINVNPISSIVISQTNSGSRIAIDDVTWTCYSAAPAPEVNLKQVTTNISSGTGEYDFGNQLISTSSSAVTFTIENLGNANLTIGTIAKSGGNTADFTIDQSSTTSPVSGPGSTTFTVSFTPSAIGARSTTISIPNNDADEAPYNFTVKGNGSYSSASTVIDNTNYSSGTPEFNIDPEYINFTDGSATSTGKFIPMKLKILDGPDSDDKNTTLTNIRFTVTDLSATNRLAMIKSAILTTSGGTPIATATKVGNELVFSGMSGNNVTAFDLDAPTSGSGEKIIHLRVSIDETQVIDKTKLIFKVTSTTSDPTGSVFAAADAGGAQSDASSAGIAAARNRLNVTATKLLFSTVSDGTVNVNLPAFTISATDVNNRLDTDVSGLITITTSGTGMSGGTGNNLSNGVASISNVQFNAAQGPITLSASAASLTGSSDDFNISALLPAAQGSFVSRTGAGSYHDASSWSRCNQIGGCTGFTPGFGGWGSLGANGTPSASVDVYIRGTITLTNALGVANSTIFSGGTLIVQNQHGVSGTMKVESGGKVVNDDRLNFSGAAGSAKFIVEDNGIVEINNYTNASNTTLWNGEEIFSEGSQVYINYGRRDALLFTPESVISTNAATGAKFGHLILQPSVYNEPSHWNGIFPNGTYQLTKNDFTIKSFDRNLTFNGSNITIGRDMIINADGAGDIVTSSASGTNSLNVIRDVIKNGTGIFRLNGSGNSSLNIDRDLTINSGSFRFGGFLPNTISNLNLKGNLLIETNAVLEAGDAASFANNRFNFSGTYNNIAGTGIQTIDVKAAGSDKNRYITFSVKPGACAQLKTQDFVLGNNSSLNLEEGSILNFGFNGSTALVLNEAASSTTTFTMAGAAKIFITHPNGIDATGTTALDGNVRTDTRTYSTSGIYHYIGKAPFQRVGDGLAFGGSSAKHVIVELDALSTQLLVEANSGSSTSIFNSLDIGLANTGDGLKIIQGTVIGKTGGDFWGTGKLEMTGGEYRISTVTATPASDYLPRLSGYSSYSLTGGTIHLNGSNSIQILSGTPAYYKLKFSGTNTFGTPTGANFATDYKGISTAITSTNLQSVEITDGIVDVQNNLGAVNTALIMSGGRFRIGVGGTQPAAGGTVGGYDLSGGVLEFYNSPSITIRQSTASPARYYKNIEVSGSNVSSAGVILRDVSTFMVNRNGMFTPNPDEAHVTGQSGSQNVTVKAGGTFITKNLNGFSGSANTSVTNEIETVTLETYDLPNSVTGSTIDYQKSGNQVITNSLPYANLIISGSGIKTAPGTDLIINGNLTGLNDGIFAHNDGTVSLSGNQLQTYTATTTHPFSFYNVTINNTHANGVAVASNMSVIRRMAFNINAKKLSIAAGQLITIKSDTVLTAQVAAVPAGMSIDYNSTGKFEIERSLRTYKGWRFLATPIVGGTGTQTISDAWREGAASNTDNPHPGYGTQLTGPGGLANGFDQTTTASAIKWYNTATNSYVNITSTNLLTDTIARKEGYMVFVRGDRSVDISGVKNSTILRTRGQMLTGDQTYNVGANAVISVGNPYPSAIDADSLFNLNTNLVSTYSAWDPSIGGNNLVGGYQAISATNGYQATASSTGPSAMYIAGLPYQYIQSGQAVYLKNFSAAPLQFKINEGMKEDVASLAVNRGGATDEREYMRVKLYNADGLIVDGNAAVFSAGFSAAIDAADANKLTNSGENFGILQAGKKLAVEARAKVVVTDTIFYTVSNLKQSGYKFGIAPVDFKDPLLSAFMVDKFSNTKTPVSLTDSSFFNFAVTAEAGSKAEDRFIMVFMRSTAGPLPVTFISLTAQRQADRSIAVNWKVANEINIVKYEVERSATGSQFSSIISRTADNSNSYNKADVSPLAADNFYRIKAVGLAGDITYSDIVKVTAEKITAAITLTQVPVKNKQLSVRFEGQTAGRYSLQLTNTLGQVIYQGNVLVNVLSEIKQVNLPANTAAGTYQLSIRNSNGDALYGESIVIE